METERETEHYVLTADSRWFAVYGALIDGDSGLENWPFSGSVASGHDILSSELPPSRTKPYGSANYLGERPVRTPGEMQT